MCGHLSCEACLLSWVRGQHAECKDSLTCVMPGCGAELSGTEQEALLGAEVCAERERLLLRLGLAMVSRRRRLPN